MLPGYHPLQVLRQGHVEGGARPSRAQEDRLQGDREEGIGSNPNSNPNPNPNPNPHQVTEKKGDGKKSAEAAADGLLAQSKGSGLSDAEVHYLLWHYLLWLYLLWLGPERRRDGRHANYLP